MTFGEDNTEVPGDGMFLKTHFSPTNPLNKIDLTELGIILGRWGKRLKKKKSHLITENLQDLWAQIRLFRGFNVA